MDDRSLTLGISLYGPLAQLNTEPLRQMWIMRERHRESQNDPPGARQLALTRIDLRYPPSIVCARMLCRPLHIPRKERSQMRRH